MIEEGERNKNKNGQKQGKGNRRTAGREAHWKEKEKMPRRRRSKTSSH
jgi:hypothetical protein